MADIPRFEIFVDFTDGFLTFESFKNGEFVRFSDVPDTKAQRLSITLWDAGTRNASMNVEEDNSGDWVKFDTL